jgi:hypothetical protein
MLDEERAAVDGIGAGCEISTAGMAVDVGRIIACCGSGQVLVDNGDSEPRAARVAAHLSDEQLAAAVAGHQDALIACQHGDPERPIVVGLLRMPDDAAVRDHRASPLEAVVDGETVVLEARKQVVLRCGKASITLTRAGKVILRGTYVLSRSSGANRIKGGSVQIN